MDIGNIDVGGQSNNRKPVDDILSALILSICVHGQTRWILHSLFYLDVSRHRRGIPFTNRDTAKVTQRTVRILLKGKRCKAGLHLRPYSLHRLSYYDTCKKRRKAEWEGWHLHPTSHCWQPRLLTKSLESLIRAHLPPTRSQRGKV